MKISSAVIFTIVLFICTKFVFLKKSVCNIEGYNIICCEGYRLNNESKCEPICVCKNGYCDDNSGKCICYPYWEKSNSNNSCYPVCNPSCINSVCTSPNNCTCKEGYSKKSLKHKCEPICEPRCINSKCISPNECSCIEGYSKTLLKHECEPVCDPKCINSNCTSPNECTCMERYSKKRLKYNCEPDCKESCTLSGHCEKPYECTCNQGYELKQDACMPICDPGCVNGTCVEPNSCKCDEGFQNKINETNICIPKCEPECINGRCIAPDSCDCESGWEGIDCSIDRPLLINGSIYFIGPISSIVFIVLLIGLIKYIKNRPRIDPFLRAIIYENYKMEYERQMNSPENFEFNTNNKHFETDEGLSENMINLGNIDNDILEEILRK